ncbi:MAG: endonuclease MutS2 [Treponema sp.]|jgi:DNA mismatch repair protein MutS2|nr:endonuclease MutS2 [Treponema sp.]
MNEKTESILEFDAIRSRVACCSFNEEAKRRILAEKPCVDADGVRRLKRFVWETVGRMKSGDEEKQESLPDIKFLLPKLAVEGASLDPDEAFAIGLFVERGSILKNWLAPLSLKDTSLRQLTLDIPDCTSLAREVFRIFNKDGSLKDLPEFQEINRRIRRLASELDAAVARYAGNEESRRMLQSKAPSQRDGRAVLAVKANFRGRIRGIVHEVSATGQTLFIEPEDVVEKNNDILIERRRLDAEILRVLRELTAKIADNREILTDFHEKIILIEIIRAKARYSKDIQGVFAKESGDDACGGGRIIILKQARHPLLGHAAVPVDFIMNEGKGAVIITGPNTGGKTVTLKTVGLFALMNQSGLAVPAADGTSLPIFDGVFTDIGDEQSISQSLSTFSAHMINIAAITASASAQSLVMLDELGAGTDPEEGSAIAMAILDYLIEKRVSLIVTTHHGVLKNYGYTREYVENASVEFDSRTLSPTYRIVMGVPGESRAVDIASRNGVRAEIIAKARSYINEERADVSSLIAGLKRKHRDLDAVAEDQSQEEKRLCEERRAVDLKELRLRRKEMEIKSGEVGRLRKLLDESRRTLENLVRELKEGEITREKTLKVKDFLNDLEKSAASETNALNEEERALQDRQKERDNDVQAPASPQPPPLVEGAEVLAASYKQRGTIIRQEKNGWLVEIGSLRIILPAEELTPATSAQGVQKQLKPALVAVDLSQRSTAVMELKVMGMRLEEAVEALQRQIDAAVLSGLKEFTVIHGKGGGVLQKGVHDLLKKDQRIADFHFSRPELGGSGRTEVVLTA